MRLLRIRWRRSMYILKIRVGHRFYPVNWERGKVCWDVSIKPTVFNEESRQRVHQELIELYGVEDYRWTKHIELV
jgi:hypothetical protein